MSLDALVSSGALELGGFAGLLALLFWMLATGRLVTRREADSYRERAEKAEAARDEVTRQNGELMEMARLGQATFAALRQGIEQ